MQYKISFQRRSHNYALHGSVFGSQSFPDSGNPYKNYIMNPIPNTYAAGAAGRNTFSNYTSNNKRKCVILKNPTYVGLKINYMFSTTLLFDLNVLYTILDNQMYKFSALI